MPRSLRLAVPIAVLVTLGGSTAAQAGTLTVPPCVRQIPGAKTFPVQGSGFTPMSFLRVTADGQVIGSTQVDAAGNVNDALFPPLLSSSSRNQQTFQIAADDGAGQTFGPVAVPVTRVSVEMPARAKPASRVRYRLYGFNPGQRVYLHVRRGGKTRGTFSMGTAAGPCGTLTKRLRYMPVRRYSSGTYDYYFGHTSKFVRAQQIYRVKINIFRTFR
jgi:hypothetical protein